MKMIEVFKEKMNKSFKIPGKQKQIIGGNEEVPNKTTVEENK